MPELNPEKHYLGKLCPRGHEYLDTGKSLRSKTSRGCLRCVLLSNKRSKNWLKPKNVERKRLYDKKYRIKNREKRIQQDKDYYSRKDVKKRMVFLAKKRFECPEYRENRRAVNKAGSLKDREKLSDGYMRANIHKITKIDYKDITLQMVELQRELLTFHRLKKELINGINSRRDKRTKANGKAAR